MGQSYSQRHHGSANGTFDGSEIPNYHIEHDKYVYIIVSQNTDARNLRFGICNRLAVLHPEKIDHRDDLQYLYHENIIKLTEKKLW